MIFQKKDHLSVGQNAHERKPKKHDANLQKNTTLYFQVGLILTLFAVYGLFEMQFKNNPIIIPTPPLDDIEDVYVMADIKIYQEPKNPIEKKPERKMIRQIPKVIDTDFGLKKLSEITTPITDIGSQKPPEVEPILSEEPISIIAVEQAPIYPGCEEFSSNLERRNCMSEKLGKFVRKKFNTEIASELGLDGRQRISVFFKIDKSGLVSDIKAKANHSKLEKEASRVIGNIPKITPGKQKNKNVEVIYSLPILFKVQN